MIGFNFSATWFLFARIANSENVVKTEDSIYYHSVPTFQYLFNELLRG
jgi:hypothetical protein